MGAERLLVRADRRRRKALLKAVCNGGEHPHPEVAYMGGECPLCRTITVATQVVEHWRHRCDMEAMTKRALQWRVVG